MAEIREVAIEDERVKKFLDQCVRHKESPLVMIEPYGQVLFKKYMDYHDRIKNFEVFDDDVWVATFPKSGTTWMQEIIWCLKNGLDFKKAKSQPQLERFPHFELNACVDTVGDISSFDVVDALQRPRLVKTHLTFELLPKQLKEKKAKIVYVYRNPRDVCVSFLNHCRIVDKYSGDLKTMVDMFLSDKGPLYSPYFPHIFGYLDQKTTNPNLFIVSYEEMLADLPHVIGRLAKFLDVTVSDEGICELCRHVSFNEMKENPMVDLYEGLFSGENQSDDEYQGKFMNKGKNGTWKEHLTDDMIKQFEEWEAKWMKDTDLKFIY